MKKQVLVIGNMRRFVCFLSLYTLLLIAAVTVICLLAFRGNGQSADSANVLISLADSVLMI